MKKSILFLFVLIAGGVYQLKAQSRVFKEVGNEIQSKIATIKQDGALVGYLQFTQLERANEDSFNYRVSIIDENLNDIGKIEFKEIKLQLKGVTFESDVLCLAYLKSNVIGKDASKRKDFKAAKESAKNSFFTQFLSLEGKIIKSTEIPIDIDVDKSYTNNYKNQEVTGGFKRGIQIVNIPQKGFVSFYGDNTGSNLVFFGTNGEIGWKKKVDINERDGIFLNNTTDAVYLLKKSSRNSANDGGFSVLSYDVTNGTAAKEYQLVDKEGHSLKVTSFEKDPSTGKLSVSGTILYAPDSYTETARGYTIGKNIGAFNLLFDGLHPNQNKESDFIWKDKSKMPDISKKGFFYEPNRYFAFDNSFRDNLGNTYFVGNSIKKNTRYGGIAFSVITSPIIIIPAVFLGLYGWHKYKISDGMVVRLDDKNNLKYMGTIPMENSSYLEGRNGPYSAMNTHSFQHISNAADKSDFVLADDDKKVVIYSLQKNAIIKTIPHKESRNVTLDVFSAKEGHILIVEYNKKDKTRTLSIEKI